MEHAKAVRNVCPKIQIALRCCFATGIGAEQTQLSELVPLRYRDCYLADFVQRIDVLSGCGSLGFCQRRGGYWRNDHLTVAFIEQQLITCADAKLLPDGNGQRQLSFAGHSCELQSNPSLLSKPFGNLFSIIRGIADSCQDNALEAMWMIQNLFGCRYFLHRLEVPP